MHKLLKFDKEIYLLKDGMLKSLGTAENVTYITKDICHAQNDLFKKDGNKFDLVIENVTPYRIYSHARANMPAWIHVLASCRCAVDKKQVNHALWDKYCELVRQRSENNTEEAVVVIPTYQRQSEDNKPRLLFSEKGFAPDFGAKLYPTGRASLKDFSLEGVVFLGYNCMVYKGQVYTCSDTERNCYNYPFMSSKVERNCWTKVDNALIMSAKDYMIFYAGEKSIFALEQEGNQTMFNALGYIHQIFKTDVSDLVIVTNWQKDNLFELYHLGEKLELLARFEILGDCKIDKKTGYVSIHRSYVKLDDSGNPVLKKDGECIFIKEDIECVFKNGRYERTVR